MSGLNRIISLTIPCINKISINIRMNPITKVTIILFLFILSSCITQFVPKTNEDKELIVVEGLITDQPGINTIKLSKSLPLGTTNLPNPATGYGQKIQSQGN
jgi:hypothetical protein